MKRKTAPPKKAQPTKKARTVLVPNKFVSFRGEIKAVDFGGTTIRIDDTGQLATLNTVTAGSSFYQRIGRRIELLSVEIRGNIGSVRTVTASDFCRLLIIYDRQPNGAVPNLADVLQNVNGSGTATSTAYAGINLNNRDRFDIIMDKKIILPTQTITAGVLTNPGWVDPVAETFNIKAFRKLGNRITQYKADTNPPVIGDIASGALYLMTVGSQPTGSEGFQLGFSTRVRFSDRS